MMKATKPIMFRVRNIMIAFFRPCSDVTLRTLLFMMKVRVTKIDGLRYGEDHKRDSESHEVTL